MKIQTSTCHICLEELSLDFKEMVTKYCFELDIILIYGMKIMDRRKYDISFIIK